MELGKCACAYIPRTLRMISASTPSLGANQVYGPSLRSLGLLEVQDGQREKFEIIQLEGSSSEECSQYLIMLLICSASFYQCSPVVS